MKVRINILTCLFFLVCSYSFGQIEEYNFKRELRGISNQWHTITLPDEVFGKVSQDLNDIRIFGVTEKKDTIEAPYLLRIANKESVSSNEVVFKTLNTSYNDNGYYFTFEIPTSEPVNRIKLDFSQKNFDWRIKLEGSQNQKDWYTITDNYRVLSIKNNRTDFQFTELTFPSSKYRYFRVLIKSKEKPYLSVASITQNEIKEGTFRNYKIKNFDIKENRKSKQTEIDVELKMPVPISHLKIVVSDTFDYYRPITIKYLSDSVKTEKGWLYNYRTLTSGTLNSIEKSGFNFKSTTIQKLKIVIHNGANQPLEIDEIQVKGYLHELVARFTEKATYFLTYGNQSVSKPNYDINHFANKIPNSLTKLELGEELILDKEETIVAEPLFKNKAWLWAVMSFIILLLGWFSLKMIRK